MTTMAIHRHVVVLSVDTVDCCLGRRTMDAPRRLDLFFSTRPVNFANRLDPFVAKAPMMRFGRFYVFCIGRVALTQNCEDAVSAATSGQI